MNRRGFLGLLAGALAAEVIPFGRVWSFPTKIVVPDRTVRIASVSEQMLLLEPDSIPLYVMTTSNAQFFAKGDYITWAKLQ